MDRSSLSKFILLFAIVALFANTVAVRKDYQDSWVLEGLEISFALFVGAYVFAFFSEESVLWIVMLAVIGQIVFLSIPNLKYVWFQGTAIDQHIQYSLADNVYHGGYIASRPGFFNTAVYGSTPLIHLAFAIFSIVLGIPVVDSVKFLPVLLSPIYPLLTYTIMKNLKFPLGTTALKYALFISAIPVSLGRYVVTGAQFGILLTLLILSSVVTLLKENDRRHWFIFIFLIFTLAAMHSVSSLLLTTFLVTIMLIQKIRYFRLKSYLTVPAMLAVASICVGWLVFRAGRTVEEMWRVVFVGVPTGTTPEGGYVPSRFFELARVDMLGAIKAFLVIYGAEVLLLILTIGGLLILLKMRKQVDHNSKFLLLLCALMLLLIPIGLYSKVGGFRILYALSPLFPVFCGILVSYVSRKKVWLPAIVFFSIAILAPLQLYSCQPLIPSGNVLSKDLPTSEPIVYVTLVNSIYQRQMIDFASDYVDGIIACDRVTKNQIIGLTKFDFSVVHLAPGGYYPLDKNQRKTAYDYFLVHFPGVAGGFDEKAEVRTRDLILGTMYNSSIIYTNGESHVIVSDPHITLPP